MTALSEWSKLAPPIAALLEEKGWTPTPVQSAGMDALLAGQDRMLVAATGSGKTEAAILPLFSRALEEAWEGLSILYITPLRALNRDIDRRLIGLGASLGITVGLRHGDTPQSERNRQSRKPPNMLVTTPETCQLLLMGSRLREHLRDVRAIVVDEVHEVAASERGAQLLIAMERVNELAGRRAQRIGLSATVGNPDEVARWLSPRGEAILAEAPRETVVQVEAVPQTPEDEALSLEWSTSPRAIAALRLLASQLREEHPALVFVNSRNAAETIAQRLNHLDSGLDIGVHHGSLAASMRQEMENRLQAGELHALVCTSSLELGIDVGAIRRVHQVQSPRAVDRLLQRMGRAEHTLGGTGRGLMLAWEPDEVAESAVIARRAIAGQLEGIEWRRRPQSVAANQFVLMALTERIVPLPAATELLTRTSIFDDWEHRETLALLRVLDDRWLVRLVEDPQSSDPIEWAPSLWEKLATTKACKAAEVPEKRPKREEAEEMAADPKQKAILDGWRQAMRAAVPKHLEQGWYSSGTRTRTYFQKHLSMIPDATRYFVRDAVTRRAIGNVDEAFVLSLDDGGKEEDGAPRRFVMMGRTWEMVEADPEKGELLVAPVSDAGHAPVWSGELPPVPPQVAREVGALRRAVADLIAPGREEETEIDPVQAAWIGGMPAEIDIEDLPLGESAVSLLAQTVSDHMDSAGHLPDERNMAIEVRRDAIVLHSLNGSRINETLAHFLQAMGSTLEGKMGRVLVDPYRISLQVPGLTSAHIIRWLEDTPPSGLADLLRVTIPNGRQLRWRLVQVCKTMGVLRGGVDPRKINLTGIANRYKGTPVMDEALDKLFHERMDIPGTVDLLKAIQSGLVRIEARPPGKLGLSPRAERDLLLPNWSDAEVRRRLEGRLMNERAIAVCLRCQSPTRFRVARWPELPPKCTSCGATMRAVAREGLGDELKKWVVSEDEKTQSRMMRNAELVQNRGLDAILCLMARGIGEDTATRVLRGAPPGTPDMLFKRIHEAELQYARTRRFWG